MLTIFTNHTKNLHFNYFTANTNVISCIIQILTVIDLYFDKTFNVLKKYLFTCLYNPMKEIYCRKYIFLFLMSNAKMFHVLMLSFYFTYTAKVGFN